MRLLTALLAATLTLSTQGNGRAQLLPAGEFAARDGRPGNGKTWRVTDAQGAKLAAAMNAIAAQTPVVIDYEHQTLSSTANGKPAPAAGWITAVEWVPGEGLFGTVEWTAAAKAAILAGEYRYISPVIVFDEQTGEVQGVQLAALTNYPGLLGMDAVTAALSAINQAGRTPGQPNPNPQEPAMAKTLVSLAPLVGLAVTATEADVEGAVTALKATADAAKARPAVPAALTAALGIGATADEAAALAAITALKGTSDSSTQTIAALQGQLAALSKQVNDRAVTEVVDAALAAGKLVPAQRDWAMKLGQSDMAQLTAFVAGAPVIPGLKGQPKGGNGDGDSEGGEMDVQAVAREAVALRAKLAEGGVQITASQAVDQVMAKRGQTA